MNPDDIKLIDEEFENIINPSLEFKIALQEDSELRKEANDVIKAKYLLDVERYGKNNLPYPRKYYFQIKKSRITMPYPIIQDIKEYEPPARRAINQLRMRHDLDKYDNFDDFNLDDYGSPDDYLMSTYSYKEDKDKLLEKMLDYFKNKKSRRKKKTKRKKYDTLTRKLKKILKKL
jgi:hypothetical protein